MRWWTIMCVAIATAIALPASAQDNSAGIKVEDGEKNPDRKKQRKERFAKVRQKLLRQKLGLSDDKSAKVEVILDSYQSKSAELRAAKQQGRQDLAKLFREDSDDQEAFSAALAKLEKAHVDEIAVKQEHFAQLKKVLTPKEQAKLLRGMNKLRRHLADKRSKRGAPDERPGPDERKGKRAPRREKTPGF